MSDLNFPTITQFLAPNIIVNSFSLSPSAFATPLNSAEVEKPNQYYSQCRFLSPHSSLFSLVKVFEFHTKVLGVSITIKIKL
jgi:hypothetical protein